MGYQLYGFWPVSNIIINFYLILIKILTTILKAQTNETIIKIFYSKMCIQLFLGLTIVLLTIFYFLFLVSLASEFKTHVKMNFILV
jgi:hypothetical protein